MKHKIKISAITFLIGIITSCQKDELPVPKHESGNVITANANMNSDYKYQLFYDLETNAIVSQNIKTAWDLGFETSESGYRIILNSSKAMFAYNTGQTNFAAVTDTTGFAANKKWDAPAGNLDTTAIGDWKTNPAIYILDRGYNPNGQKIGFKKIQLVSADEYKYTIRYADLNGTGDTTLQILKDDNYNFTFLSFNTNSTVIVEPPKTDWDIVFTQYIEALSTPYLVTGALLNRYNTLATMDSEKTFSQITYENAMNYTLSSNINSIGYEWKEYDYNSGTYIIFPQKIYIIKDSKGYYYKLHFIDFYDQSGNKGNPKWEYQKL